MWDSSTFEVNSIEYGGQWISLCGKHVNSSFNCMIIGVYAASSVQDRVKLWEDITTLKFAFNLPMVVIGDFNEILHAHERSSGYINHSGSAAFRNFLSDCALIEFKLQGSRFTWFRGGSMSCIDRAFASLEFHLQFPFLSLCRYPRGMSDHCQLLLQTPKVDWGWKPFRFIKCWLSHPSFLADFETLWFDSCKEFPGDYRLVKKLGTLGKKLRQWNKTTFGRLRIFGDRNPAKIGAKWGIKTPVSSTFQQPQCRRIEMGGLGFSKISEERSVWLERLPSLEEVKQAVWDCDGSKAPGHDRFTFSFYKKVWNLISSDIFVMVKEFFRTVVKLLSTRLRSVLPDVISVNQFAFIAGRQILDGFMIANEVVHAIRSKKDHEFLLKVDFHKAFDSILWEHIDSTMGYMGFGSHWRNLIFECLSTSKLAILINGSPSREFSMERGLRQGDPLSSFLFDIAVQGPIVLFNRASDSDDTLIFLPNDYSSLLHAKRILCWFEIISRLKVNFYKSSLIGINLDNEYTSGLPNVIFCRSNTFPVRYLGLPLGANPNRLSTWKSVLSIIRAKLSNWKWKILSMAGRICLIKSVLNSLPLYYMSVFTMPKGITKAISSINRCFLWKSTSNSHGICKVAWHKVIKSKPLRGLGLGSIHNKNLALMFKWLWNLDKGVVGGSLSPTWRGMVSAISLNHSIAAPLQSNVGFKMGDERNIRPLRSREFCMRESLLAEVERGLVFSDGEDNKIWKSDSSNIYSVSSGCHLLDGFNVSTNLYSLDLLWKGFTPLKIDVFIWLLLNGSICTKGFLAKRRIINYEEALCPFCCKEIETIHHLFHLCPIS
ncbi:uncharacterized protein LOC133702794 [Populus nigra]|uniref:uncharacterized protein LOC133702794 n=1 Tax=Populus nigra TaxID=3691 RepID=UPI002B276685|nr:uncharacterized protein LOC133702794 [Populus nigra]